MEKCPEKWYVVRNKANHKILNSWINKETKDRTSANLGNRAYFFIHDRDGASYRANAPAEYIEITFEQFKEWILKEEKVDDLLIFN